MDEAFRVPQLVAVIDAEGTLTSLPAALQSALTQMTDGVVGHYRQRAEQLRVQAVEAALATKHHTHSVSSRAHHHQNHPLHASEDRRGRGGTSEVTSADRPREHVNDSEPSPPAEWILEGHDEVSSAFEDQVTKLKELLHQAGTSRSQSYSDTNRSSPHHLPDTTRTLEAATHPEKETRKHLLHELSEISTEVERLQSRARDICAQLMALEVTST
jgi:hypothetical protein